MKIELTEQQFQLLLNVVDETLEDLSERWGRGELSPTGQEVLETLAEIRSRMEVAE